VIGKISIDPASVEITGPESAVKQAAEAITETVSVVGARAPVVENVTVGLLDPALRLRSPRLATVHIEVLPGPTQRQLRLPVRLHNVGEGLSARSTPSTVDVAIRGSREGLSHIDAGDVNAFVDLSGLGIGDYPIEVRVDTPADAGVAKVEPASVQVHISAKD
jgi:YbbR domain-containing protein